jgi:hypothetical protein
MSKNLEQEAILKKCRVDLQMHVINTLLSIMRDNSYIAKDRIKAAELLSKISSTIFNDNK